jgi:hypothetical protein
VAIYTGIGSRQTPEDILISIEEIARELALRGNRLRSGGAPGADQAFEKGARSVNEEYEIFLPWPGFQEITRSKYYPYDGLRPTDYKYPTEEAFTMAKMFHPAWNRLNEWGKKFHARNVHQVLGYDLKTPSDLVICWTEGGALKGGTAQAMRIASHYNIPIINLALIDGEEVYEEIYSKTHLQSR